MKISKIILYNEPSVLEIDIKKLKKFIENIFQIKIEIRNNIFENINEKTCENIASSRIFNLKKTFQKHIPSIEEISIELENKDMSNKEEMILYDGIELSNIITELIPNEEENGRLKPALDEVSNESSLPGVDYITQTVAKRIEDVTEDELSPGVVEGKVYVVRMTQLYNKGGAAGLELLKNGNELKAGIVNSSDDTTVLGNSVEYDDGYMTLQVEFFPLNNNLYAYVTGSGGTPAWDFDKLGTPVATQNIAIRR